MRYIIREKMFRLGEDSDILDENNRPVYSVDGKIFSLHHTLVMRDMAGDEVATVRQHIVSLRPTFEVTRHGQEIAEVRKKLLSPFVDRYTIDIPGPDDLTVTGSIFEHEYTISRGSEIVARVSKGWLTLTATYAVDITPGQDDPLILATVLALDLVEDEEDHH